LSRQRICQIEARALFLLRRVIRDNDPLCCMSRGRC
jgi:DNA-directed RNA polymerase sigma subunit (sigma70/sigma32)